MNEIKNDDIVNEYCIQNQLKNYLVVTNSFKLLNEILNIIKE